MDTTNTIELRDESIYPDHEALRSVLGKSFEAYEALLRLFENNQMQYEWRYYKDGKAWLCKVQKKKKTIVWMSAWKGYIQVAIYFPERLLHTVLDLDIDEIHKKRILNTENVGRSRPCIFEIREKEVLTDFEQLMHLKIKAK